MPIEAVANRIKAEATDIKFVGISADLPAANEQVKKAPSAYVLPGVDSAGDNQLVTGDVRQLVEVRFSVLLAVRNVSDAAGAASLGNLKNIRKALKDALIGWAPGGDFAPILFGGGQLVRLGEDSVLWWMDDFTTQYLLSSA